VYRWLTKFSAIVIVRQLIVVFVHPRPFVADACHLYEEVDIRWLRTTMGRSNETGLSFSMGEMQTADDCGLYYSHEGKAATSMIRRKVTSFAVGVDSLEQLSMTFPSSPSSLVLMVLVSSDSFFPPTTKKFKMQNLKLPANTTKQAPGLSDILSNSEYCTSCFD
jgi:hypothetical protein